MQGMEMGQDGEALDRAECAVILGVCASLQLKKASRVVTRLYDDALRPVGIRSTQLPILVELAVNKSLLLQELAHRMVVNRTTLTRNLNPLEAQGLIRIDSGTDRRTKVAKLTLAGEAKLVNAVPLWRAAQSRVVTALGIDQLETLRSVLSRLISNLSDVSQPGTS